MAKRLRLNTKGCLIPMLKTNCQYLHPEICDVLRIFNAQDEDFTHYFSYSNGVFFNSIEYNGAFFDFEHKKEVDDDTEYKRYAKRFSKLAFYDVLSKKKGIEMPWGALTGIRPTKLAYMSVAGGEDFQKTLRDMRVSEDNIALVADVLNTQKHIYSNAGGQDFFISLPFCPTKCEYCSFITAPLANTKQFVSPYVDCLIKEINSVKDILKIPKSIYIGGGTPFAIDTYQLERIYTAINALNLPKIEYTVEAGRPDVFSDDKLKLSKDFGVTRICINPQSFSDKTLVAIGRKHTEKQIYEAFEMSDKYGFDVNVDLIAGLTGESVEDFERSLVKAIELNPSNITVHTLSLKSGARLKESVKSLNVNGIDKMIALSRKYLKSAGYNPYYMYRQKYQAGGRENCGWAKTGKECVYNVDVMEEIADNVAVGANAISKKLFDGGERIERCASPKDLKTYIEKVDKIISDREALFCGAKE